MGKQKTLKNNQLAELFLCAYEKDGHNIVYARPYDCYFSLVDGKYYQAEDPYIVKRAIVEFVNTFYKGEVSVTEGLISDVYKQLAYICEVQDITANDRYIALDDCMVDLETFQPVAFGAGKVATLYFPFTWSQIQTARTPVFSSFIETTLVDEENVTTFDPSLAVVMQEMVGNLLLPHMHAASCFFLVGHGANGKSTWAKLIASLFGKQYISAYSIESVTTRPFVLAGIIGKKVNICNEEESKYIRSDKFKAIVAGDTVSAERKYGASFEFEPTTKFLFCSNNMPSFDGVDYGLKRRIKIIPFNRRFSPSERDYQLDAKLQAELPGILKWALQGAKRLVDRRYTFSDEESRAMRKASEEFENQMSSALYYFREHWQLSDIEDDFISNKDMYSHYKKWCEDNGRKPLGAQNFHQDIGRMTGVVLSKKGGERGKRVSSQGGFDMFAPQSSDNPFK